MALGRRGGDASWTLGGQTRGRRSPWTGGGGVRVLSIGHGVGGDPLNTGCGAKGGFPLNTVCVCVLSGRVIR